MPNRKATFICTSDGLITPANPQSHVPLQVGLAPALHRNICVVYMVRKVSSRCFQVVMGQFWSFIVTFNCAGSSGDSSSSLIIAFPSICFGVSKGLRITSFSDPPSDENLSVTVLCSIVFTFTCMRHCPRCSSSLAFLLLRGENSSLLICVRLIPS